MAGRARYQAIHDELDRRARHELGPDDAGTQPSTLDYVCSRIEAGTTAKAIAKELEDACHFPIDYAMLMRFLRDRHGEGRAESAIDAARARASHCFAEESLELVDAYADTSHEVSRAQSRARSRQWYAQAWNPSRYGQQKGAVQVNVSIASLHLEALKAPGMSARVAESVTSGAAPLRIAAVTGEQV